MPPLRTLVAALILATPAAALGAIKKPLPLKEVIAQEEVIVLATVEAADPHKPSLVLKVTEHLKGKPPAERIAVNMTGDSEATKLKQVPELMARLTAGRSVVVFVSMQEANYTAFGFCEGTWFQLQGTRDGEAIRWALLHAEPYLRRTFAGTTAGLVEVVSGKTPAPAWSEKEPPGYGPKPEPDPKKCDATGGPALFAVIPSFVLLGPLALLAAIFPGVAVRLAVVMTRWRALLATASATSTIALADYWLRDAGYLTASRFTTPTAVAGLLLAVTLAGCLWSARRYRRLASDAPAETAPPTRRAVQVLGTVAAVGGSALAALAAYAGAGELVVSPWREFTAVGVGLAAAALYATYRNLTQANTPGLHLSASPETVALAAMAVFGGVLLLRTPAAAPAAFGEAVVGERAAATKVVFQGAKILWETTDAHEVLSGVTAVEGRLYFGTAKASGFRQTGAVYCVEAKTGAEVWKFTDGGQLKPVFARPVVHGNTLFSGEGLHTDNGRRLFALDAVTGQPAWPKPFETASHTEGAAVVTNGAVVFPAGDDGVYAADAKTGAERWHLEGGPATKLHIDTDPALSGDRIFVGSGYRTRCLLAIHAVTGKELWRTPVPYRAFGAPLVCGDRVVFGLGTGNLTDDLTNEPDEGLPPEETPGGAVVALDAATGKVLWQFATPKSVHTALSADRRTVYAAGRDGTLYALDRGTGALRWQRRCGASLTAGPVVAAYAGGALPLAVYAVTTAGVAVALDPADGGVLWTRDLAIDLGREVQVYSTPTLTEVAHTRRLVFGAMLTHPTTRAKSAAVVSLEDGVE